MIKKIYLLINIKDMKTSFFLSNIDFSNYDSSKGMSTKHFGSSLWNFLFISVLGHYPMKIDIENKEHLELSKQYEYFLTSLQFLLPCIFCRESYKIFIKELPLKKFLKGRIYLFLWIYLIKDKVNKKLIKQEKKCFKDKQIVLKQKYQTGILSKEQYNKKIIDCKKKIFKTIPSPEFSKVLDYYESFRAKCSKKTKVCSIKKKLK